MRCGTRTTSAPGVKERTVRYGKEHKQATQQHIIEAAGRRFKTDPLTELPDVPAAHTRCA
jgi:hypothetical protein